VTLPTDSELMPAFADSSELLGRPRQESRLARLEALGLNTDSDSLRLRPSETLFEREAEAPAGCQRP
jgi:hypothetical protein